jgi:hypothetical protein
MKVLLLYYLRGDASWERPIAYIRLLAVAISGQGKSIGIKSH